MNKFKTLVFDIYGTMSLDKNASHFAQSMLLILNLTETSGPTTETTEQEQPTVHHMESAQSLEGCSLLRVLPGEQTLLSDFSFSLFTVFLVLRPEVRLKATCGKD